MNKITYRNTDSLWSAINKAGIFYSQTEFGYAEIVRDTEKILQYYLGEEVRHWEILDIEPTEGAKSFVKSNRQGEYHTDCHDILPAHLIFQFCIEPAALGGESLFVDSWEMLRSTKYTDPSFYDDLFYKYRAMNILPSGWIAPTFTTIKKNLIFVQPPYPSDRIGNKINDWISEQKPMKFKMQCQDFYIINNHRLAHSRTKFEGKRHLLRISVWLKRPIEAPETYTKKALLLKAKIKPIIPNMPDYLKHKLGFSVMNKGSNKIHTNSENINWDLKKIATYINNHLEIN